MKTLAIIALSLATAISGVAPAGAFPIVPAVKSQAIQTTDVQRAQFPYERGEQWKQRSYRDGYYRYGRYRDRHYRDRYRYHRHRRSNTGAIIGGLAAGLIIGGLLSQQPRYYAGGNAHTRWCYARYRSYRAYDNTFQPYSGPRRQCISPYF